ncbi:hypothetical protein HDV63DRAFT_27052 [Trichoderma sp. SZMC 28014]
MPAVVSGLAFGATLLYPHMEPLFRQERFLDPVANKTHPRPNSTFQRSRLPRDSYPFPHLQRGRRAGEMLQGRRNCAPSPNTPCPSGRRRPDGEIRTSILPWQPRSDWPCGFCRLCRIIRLVKVCFASASGWLLAVLRMLISPNRRFRYDLIPPWGRGPSARRMHAD